MPYSTGAFEDTLLIEILKQGKNASKHGITKDAWHKLIDDELQPYRKIIHVDAESLFRQFITFGFVRETNNKGLFKLRVHWAPYNRQRKISE